VFLGGTPLSQGQSLPDLYVVKDAVSGNHMEYHQMSLAKGQEAPLADLKGPGKVTYFYITDDTQVRWFPGLVLKVFWDDETEPSIQAPLSDFFGAMGGKTIDYQSAPMQINHACYMCYLPMPFSRRARFVLANDGDRDYSQSVAYGIDYEVGAAFAREKSRLHCVWRRSNPVKNGLHTLLDAQGRGHYIGGFLQVHTEFRGWWGEGDTIFELDGQPMTPHPGHRRRVRLLLGLRTHLFVSLQRLPADGKGRPPDVSLVLGEPRAFPNVAQGANPEPARQRHPHHQRRR
jgi:hypothetical protein